MPITDEEMNIRPSAEKARREVVKTQTGPGVSKTVFQERADQKFRREKRREELDVIMSLQPPTIGRFDQETSDRMRAALAEAALRTQQEQASGSVYGITQEEARVNTARAISNQRQRDMMNYFMYSPVGRIEQSGLDILTSAAGAKMVDLGANVFKSAGSNMLTRGVGEVNTKLGDASSRMYYGTSTPNIAAKGMGSPLSSPLSSAVDDVGLGTVLDINTARYSLSNPGYFFRNAMRKQVKSMMDPSSGMVQ